MGMVRQVELGLKPESRSCPPCTADRRAGCPSHELHLAYAVVELPRDFNRFLGRERASVV